MVRYNKNFIQNLKGIDLKTLESSRHSICALNRNLEFSYYNPQWLRFAKNNGLNDYLERYPIGTQITEGISGQSISDFYVSKYLESLSSGIIWQHEYECSSLDDFRQYYHGCFPMKSGAGLVLIHTQIVNVPMDRINRPENMGIVKNYLQDNGSIVQCSNCRHINRVDNPKVWDWVPSWVNPPSRIFSHSICPTCFDYHWKYSRIEFRSLEDSLA